MRLAAGAAAAAAVITLAWAGTGPAAAADQPARPSMHGSATPSPGPDHSGHDMSDMSDMDHDQHGGTPNPGASVSAGTRSAVLGGFAAVNAGVLGAAVLLRRHDRRHPRRGARPGRVAR